MCEGKGLHRDDIDILGTCAAINLQSIPSLPSRKSQVLQRERFGQKVELRSYIVKSFNRLELTKLQRESFNPSKSA